MSADEMLLEDEPKDYAKWVWTGIAVMVAVMIGAMFYLSGRDDASRSTVHARHILVKFNPSDVSGRQRALELISDLHGRIAKGEDFATLAKQWSQDSVSAARGGDLGIQFRGVYEAEFEELVWNLPIGELSEVFTTRNGFHILEVLDRKLSKMDAYQLELEDKTRDIPAQ